MVVCFVLEWQIVCVCVCARLRFLLKYLSFNGTTPRVGSQCTENLKLGGLAHMSHPAAPRTLRGPHVSATHFLQMQRRMSVCEVHGAPYIHSSYCYLIWIHTTDTEWLMIGWFFKRGDTLTTVHCCWGCCCWLRSLILTEHKKTQQTKEGVNLSRNSKRVNPSIGQYLT